MRRLKCKWFYLFFIFSLFFGCLTTSFPANAITLTLGVNPTGTEYANPEVQCSGPDYNDPFTDATIGNKTYCQIDPPTNVSDGFELRGIRTKNTYTVEEGKLYTIYLELRNNSGTIGNSKPMLWTVQPFPSDYFSLVGLSTEYTQVGLARGATDTFEYDFDEWYSDMYAITVKALKSGTTRFQLGNTTQILVTSRIVSAQYSPTYKFQVRMNRIVEYNADSTIQQSVENALESQQKKEREELEDTQSDAETSADDSSDDAESQGTTLLAAFSAFVTAITSASPSNCNLDMDLGNLDLGVVNFCQLSPPASFQAIASIFMILFFVPLSIATARKVINLFRSFQT